MGKTLIKRYWLTLVSAIIVSVDGYLYWRYVGCGVYTYLTISSQEQKYK